MVLFLGRCFTSRLRRPGLESTEQSWILKLPAFLMLNSASSLNLTFPFLTGTWLVASRIPSNSKRQNRVGGLGSDRLYAWSTSTRNILNLSDWWKLLYVKCRVIKINSWDKILYLWMKSILTCRAALDLFGLISVRQKASGEKNGSEKS